MVRQNPYEQKANFETLEVRMMLADLQECLEFDLSGTVYGGPTQLSRSIEVNGKQVEIAAQGITVLEADPRTGKVISAEKFPRIFSDHRDWAELLSLIQRKDHVVRTLIIQDDAGFRDYTTLGNLWFDRVIRAAASHLKSIGSDWGDAPYRSAGYLTVRDGKLLGERIGLPDSRVEFRDKINLANSIQASDQPDLAVEIVGGQRGGTALYPRESAPIVFGGGHSASFDSLGRGIRVGVAIDIDRQPQFIPISPSTADTWKNTSDLLAIPGLIKRAISFGSGTQVVITVSDDAGLFNRDGTLRNGAEGVIRQCLELGVDLTKCKFRSGMLVSGIVQEGRLVNVTHVLVPDGQLHVENLTIQPSSRIDLNALRSAISQHSQELTDLNVASRFAIANKWEPTRFLDETEIERMLSSQTGVVDFATSWPTQLSSSTFATATIVAMREALGNEALFLNVADSAASESGDTAFVHASIAQQILDSVRLRTFPASSIGSVIQAATQTSSTDAVFHGLEASNERPLNIDELLARFGAIWQHTDTPVARQVLLLAEAAKCRVATIDQPGGANAFEIFAFNDYLARFESAQSVLAPFDRIMRAAPELRDKLTFFAGGVHFLIDLAPSFIKYVQSLPDGEGREQAIQQLRHDHDALLANVDGVFKKIAEEHLLSPEKASAFASLTRGSAVLFRESIVIAVPVAEQAIPLVPGIVDELIATQPNHLANDLGHRTAEQLIASLNTPSSREQTSAVISDQARVILEQAAEKGRSDSPKYSGSISVEQLATEIVDAGVHNVVNRMIGDRLPQVATDVIANLASRAITPVIQPIVLNVISPVAPLFTSTMMVVGPWLGPIGFTVSIVNMFSSASQARKAERLIQSTIRDVGVTQHYEQWVLDSFDLADDRTARLLDQIRADYSGDSFNRGERQYRFMLVARDLFFDQVANFKASIEFYPYGAGVESSDDIANRQISGIEYEAGKRTLNVSDQALDDYLRLGGREQSFENRLKLLSSLSKVRQNVHDATSSSE